MKIAFFDSGIGGLTVFKEALRLFPAEDYLYFADSSNAPYGRHSEQTVTEFITDAFNFLEEKNIDLLVLACHTATKLLTDEIQQRYSFPIIKMHTGIKKTCPTLNPKATLVCGTDLSTKKWEQQLSLTGINASYLSLQKLIVFAERFDFDSPQVFRYLYERFADINWDNHDSLILGCTHFPFFKSQIKTIIPEHVQVLDGSLMTVQNLSAFIPERDYERQSSVEYFVSKKAVKNTPFLNYLKVLDSNHELIES